MPRCYIMKKQQLQHQQQQPQQQHHTTATTTVRIVNVSSGSGSSNHHTHSHQHQSQQQQHQHGHTNAKENKDDTSGPVSPTEACVAPTCYNYNSTLENRPGKCHFFILSTILQILLSKSYCFHRVPSNKYSIVYSSVNI